MDVKEGDTILFAKYAGTEFKYQGEEYLILSQKDVLAKIND
jgi:chaperonin GroES